MIWFWNIDSIVTQHTSQTAFNIVPGIKNQRLHGNGGKTCSSLAPHEQYSILMRVPKRRSIALLLQNHELPSNGQRPHHSPAIRYRLPFVYKENRSLTHGCYVRASPRQRNKGRETNIILAAAGGIRILLWNSTTTVDCTYLQTPLPSECLISSTFILKQIPFPIDGSKRRQILWISCSSRSFHFNRNWLPIRRFENCQTFVTRSNPSHQFIITLFLSEMAIVAFNLMRRWASTPF